MLEFRRHATVVGTGPTIPDQLIKRELKDTDATEVYIPGDVTRIPSDCSTVADNIVVEKNRI